MSYLDYMLSGLGAASMAACVYLGMRPGRPIKATTLEIEIEIGTLAAIATFLALMVLQHPTFLR